MQEKNNDRDKVKECKRKLEDQAHIELKISSKCTIYTPVSSKSLLVFSNNLNTFPGRAVCVRTIAKIQTYMVCVHIFCIFLMQSEIQGFQARKRIAEKCPFFILF